MSTHRARSLVVHLAACPARRPSCLRPRASADCGNCSDCEQAFPRMTVVSLPLHEILRAPLCLVVRIVGASPMSRCPPPPAHLHPSQSQHACLGRGNRVNSKLAREVPVHRHVGLVYTTSLARSPIAAPIFRHDSRSNAFLVCLVRLSPYALIALLMILCRFSPRIIQLSSTLPPSTPSRFFPVSILH
jgi:hypothetical protein